MSTDRRSSDPSLPTAAEEDYLKALFGLTEWASAPVTSSDLAVELGVANSSVTVMVRKLAARGWVEHKPYAPIAFTEEGYRVALSVVRRHRLLETFLVEKLGYTWEEVHDEADALEHAVSERFVDRIDALLGHPTEDPHGDRIPTREGRLKRSEAVLAARLDAGHPGVLERVSDASLTALRALKNAGLAPGDPVTVTEEGIESADGHLAGGVSEDVWIRAGEHEGCTMPESGTLPGTSP